MKIGYYSNRESCKSTSVTRSIMSFKHQQRHRYVETNDDDDYDDDENNDDESNDDNDVPIFHRTSVQKKVGPFTSRLIFTSQSIKRVRCKQANRKIRKKENISMGCDVKTEFSSVSKPDRTTTKCQVYLE
ncbi:hypothetical protein M0802_007047 [Mischocyttarus mexicanus]|nr:hypothetical protein M0802_007047 [Mischocyttarus mexicanus]